MRDGAQKEGVSFSVPDKLEIASRLDDLGISFIEGGWPGSNPRDAEFFQKARDLKLKNAEIVVFGSTRRANIFAEDDSNLRVMLETGFKYACLVGKSSELYVKQVLDTTPEENLAMISDSISYLKSKGMTVFFDAEHFFDGFKHNPEYSLRCLTAAAEAGAACLVLCDTNGGALPEDVLRPLKQRRKPPVFLWVFTLTMMVKWLLQIRLLLSMRVQPRFRVR